MPWRRNITHGRHTCRVGDDPVNAVDPDGKEDYRVNKQGQYYKQKSM